MIAAHTQLRLTREAAADLRRPWEKPAEPARLTPRGSGGGFGTSARTCAARPVLRNPQRPDLAGQLARRTGTQPHIDVGKTARRPETITERNRLKPRKG